MGDSETQSTFRLTRRAVLRLGLGALTAAPLAAACSQPAPPAPKPTEAAKPAAQPAAPAAPAPKPPEAAKPAAQAPGVSKARISGKLTVVQALDFHPDHNKLVETKIKEFADKQGYPLDHSYISAFAGTGNPVQKLIASVEAGDPPDLICHNSIQPAELHGLEIIEDLDTLQKEIIRDYGKTPPAFEKRGLLDGKWRAVHHFSRANGFWAVEKPFKDAGIDIHKDLDDYDKIREAALKVSKPEQESWGWGLTANRSGDGRNTVRGVVMSWGGQLADETGQLVVINKDPYRQYTVAALEWLREIHTDPKWAPMVPPGINSWTDPSNNEAYLAGKIPFTHNGGTMFAKAIVDKNPIADDTWFLPQPKGIGPGGRVVVGAGDPMVWYVMKGGKEPRGGRAVDPPSRLARYPARDHPVQPRLRLPGVRGWLG